MTANGWLQIALFTLLVALLVRSLGGYMTRVFRGEQTALGRLRGPVERGIYRLAGIDPAAEHKWLDYALALIALMVRELSPSMRSNGYNTCYSSTRKALQR